MEGAGWRVDLPPAEGCNGGGWFAGGVYLPLLLPEKSSTIYFNYAYYGPVFCNTSETRAKGGNAVVGTGGIGFIGYTDSGPGGGTNKGGGRYRQDGDCNGQLVR